MPDKDQLKEITTAIERAARSLFSEGVLAEKTHLANALSEMQGLNLFLTSVPWYIELPEGQKIIGLSETLQISARDIHAQLVSLQRILSSNTVVSIGIDQARLPKLRRASSNANAISRVTNG